MAVLATAAAAQSDSHGWMEDPARAAELRTWVVARSDKAVAGFRALPARGEFATLLEAATRAGTRYADVQEAGGRLFFRQLDPTDRTAKLMVREGAATRVLYDPAKEAAGGAGPAALNHYSASPDGRLVALHASFGGSEVGPIRFLDAASGAETLRRLEPVWGEFEPSWLPGGRIAWTKVTEPPKSDFAQNMVAVAGPMTGPFVPVLGPKVAGAKVAPTQFPLLQTGPASSWAMGLAVNAGSDWTLWLTPAEQLAAGKPIWRSAAVPSDKVRSAALLGDILFLMDEQGQSMGRVTRGPAAGGARETVPTPEGVVLYDLLATRDALYLLGYTDGRARLFMLPDGRGAAREIALPFEADFGGSAVSGDGSSLLLTLAGWTTAPRSFRVTGGQLETLGLDSGSWPGVAGIEVRLEQALSSDGTQIPMVIVTKPGTGPRPTILEAYGGYGIPTTTPWYNPYLLAWNARGHAVAYCGTRGGNERGRAWHEAGRAANKPTAHADYVACAERLVQLGVARPGGIAGMGTSAGGLLVPIAVMNRPELFGALLPRVAVLNASRLAASPNGANQFPEMGDPATAEGREALRRQDATLALEGARALPPTLVTIGLNDKRVAAWMGTKFAARAEERFPGQVQVRADTEAGHGIGTARDVQIAEWADVFAWLETQLARAPK